MNEKPERKLASSPAPRVDAADVMGLAGLGLVTAGVWGLAGWAWTCVALGAPLVGLYAWWELGPREGGRKP